LTPKAYNKNENLFLFFENRDGYNFTSYENLLSKAPYNTYSRSVKVGIDPSENFNSYDFLGVINDFDILKSVRYGAYNSTLASFDLISGKLSTKSFGYSNLSKNATLNGNAPVNRMVNRLGRSLYDSNQHMVKYVITSDSDSTTNPADVKNWLPQTSSRLAQLHTFKLVIHVPGDVLLTAGMVVNVILPKMQVQEKQVVNDDLRSGSYLVSTVHHKFVMDSMTTVMELLSDSVSVPLVPSADGSSVVQKVVKL
jgi:hypothetical protein